MEYFALVMEAFGAALRWFTRVWTADEFLFELAKALIFLNILVHLFLKPFMQGMIEGSGSDFARKSREKRQGHLVFNKQDHQKRLGSSVRGDGFTMR